MAKPDPLGVWLHGHRVAELTSRGRPGEVICRYTDEALARWPSNTPLLSCSLPLLSKAQQAGLFFRGLLPEGQHLQALAYEARLPAYDTFGLLGRYGKDVAGAIVIAAEDPGDRPGSVEPYDAEELEREVAGLPDRPLGIHDDSELSIAGLQDKLLLVDLGDGGWGRPIHGCPSTHILKVEDRRYPGMAELEAATLRIARAVGLTTVDAVVETIAGVPCLIVSRFDRAVDHDGNVTRVHQEDACQALRRDPDADRGRGKYESGGGPALRDLAALLDQFAADPIHELAQLARAATFTVTIGNADAHGKNVAVLHEEPGYITLAPLYDPVPTTMWPNPRRTAAMTVHGRRRLNAVTLDDMADEAYLWPLDRRRARAASVATAQEILDALGLVAVPPELAERIAARCRSFLSG